MQKLDFKKLFTDNVCSFEVAKKAKKHGYNSTDTFYAYDPDGNLNDGAWLVEVTGAKLFPAINVPLALGLVDELDHEKISLYLDGDKYIFDHDGEKIESTNLPDVLVMAWIKFPKK